jgi:hypothetical protein
MHTKMSGAVLGLGIFLVTIVLTGCASSPVASPPTSAPPGAIRLEQPGMTDYMRSRVGTPDELSPLAPPEARKVHKVGDHWLCEVNGQTMVYNNASACWEPRQK